MQERPALAENCSQWFGEVKTDMSRIGKKPISIPEKVKINVTENLVEVTGPKGTLSKSIPPGISVNIEDGVLSVSRENDEKAQRAFHGLMRALIANMVEGTNTGFSKILQIIGTGYRAEETEGNKITLHLGYSHTIDFKLPEGISAVVENRGTKLTIEGIDKELVGEISARIRRLRPPDAYKGKGVRYDGEKLKLKAGKSGVAK